MADLVGQHSPKPGDEVLIAKEAVQPHVVRGKGRGERVGGVVEGLRTESIERGSVEVGHAPHAGSALGARLGEQQRRAVGEHEAGLPVARLERLLGVDEQPPAAEAPADEGPAHGQFRGNAK